MVAIEHLQESLEESAHSSAGVSTTAKAPWPAWVAADWQCRYFTSYSGVKLPFKLVGEIIGEGGGNPGGAEAVRHRNTYFRGFFDPQGCLQGCEKVVYGEIEFSHRYWYHPDGRLRRAEINDGDGEAHGVDFPPT